MPSTQQLLAEHGYVKGARGSIKHGGGEAASRELHCCAVCGQRLGHLRALTILSLQIQSRRKGQATQGKRQRGTEEDMSLWSCKTKSQLSHSSKAAHRAVAPDAPLVPKYLPKYQMSAAHLLEWSVLSCPAGGTGANSQEGRALLSSSPRR